MWIWLLIFIIVMMYPTIHIVNSVKRDNALVENPINFLANNPIEEDVTFINFDNVPSGSYGKIILCEHGLKIETPHNTDIIEYKNIKSVAMQSVDNILNDGRFSLGKAAVGTALFGFVGGAIGGFGNKENTIIEGLSIRYGDSDYIIVSPKLYAGISANTIEIKNAKLKRFGRTIETIINTV